MEKAGGTVIKPEDRGAMSQLDQIQLLRALQRKFGREEEKEPWNV